MEEPPATSIIDGHSSSAMSSVSSGSAGGSSYDEDTALTAHRQALRDVYGSEEVDTFEEAEEMLAEARQKLEAALENLPMDKKTAYMEARLKVPWLVEMESNPDRFLRNWEYNAGVAALHMASYWEFRKHIFKDRAFLPMTADGRGALSPHDVEVLNTGWCYESSPDESNRRVIVSDRSRLPPEADEFVRTRNMWYVIQLASENPLGQRHGMVYINWLSATEEKTRGPPSRLAMSFFEGEHIPIIMKAVHLVILRKRSMIATAIPNWLAMFERWEFLRKRTVVHHANDAAGLGMDMKQYGLASLPDSLGGDVGFEEDLGRWVQEQRKYDIKRQEDVLAATTPVAVATDPNPAQVRVDERKKRKRELDAIYQKRKREMRKQDLTAMTKNLELLKMQNKSLKEEHNRLNSLWAQALQHVDVYERSRMQSMINAPAMPGVPAQPYKAEAASFELVKHLMNSYRSASGHPQSSGSNSQTLENLVALQLLEQEVAAVEEQRARALEGPVNYQGLIAALGQANSPNFVGLQQLVSVLQNSQTPRQPPAADPALLAQAAQLGLHVPNAVTPLQQNFQPFLHQAAQPQTFSMGLGAAQPQSTPTEEQMVRELLTQLQANTLNDGVPRHYG